MKLYALIIFGLLSIPCLACSEGSGSSPSGRLGGVYSPAFTGTCNLNLVTPPSSLRIAASTDKLLMQNADDIANGQLNFSKNNTSLTYIARRQLYSHLALQQINPNISPSLKNFATLSKNNNLFKFALVDSLMNSSDSSRLGIAAAINSTIRTMNEVEVTQKQFNSQYIQFAKNKGTASASDVAAFESIAVLCPNVNGLAVHQARTILFNITQKQYINDCEINVPSASAKRLANGLDNVSEATEVMLYPNPAFNELFVDAKDYSEVTLKLYSVMGSLVINQSISTNQKIDISHLARDLYLQSIP